MITGVRLGDCVVVHLGSLWAGEDRLTRRAMPFNQLANCVDFSLLLGRESRIDARSSSRMTTPGGQA